MTTYCVCSF